jgi:glycosyltransferase involved in cell wall biosynthesis
MKIALITPGFSASDEDWCIPVLQDLARELNDRHDVRVYASCYPPGARDFVVKGVPVHSEADHRSGRLAWARRQYRTAAAIVAEHRARPFDVMHGFWADGGAIIAALVRRKLSLPSVLTVMGGELTWEPRTGYGKGRRPVGGRIARFGAERSSSVLVNSGFHAARLAAAMPTLETRVLPLGVDTSRISRDGEQVELAGSIPIVTAASLLPVKGHSALLRAFDIARREVAGLHLHVVGDGPELPALRSVVGSVGIDDLVTFHGHQAHDEMPKYYRAASFCVLASAFETHAMVALEAAACGRLTIGSRVGSLPELCPEQLLVEPLDAESLAGNIVSLASDPGMIARLSERASQKVSSSMSLVGCSQAFEEHYQCLAV